MNINNLRGTVDILPESSYIWQWIETQARTLFSRFNVKEIRTPIFERTELFSRTIGAQTDIVSKEMYTFSDRKNRSITLRPEGTASIVRSVIQHKLFQENVVNKFFYMGPMFRYERPQAGRQRQFHQVGVEITGSDKPLADIEAIFLLKSFFDVLGLDGVKFRINSSGSKKYRPVLNNKLKDILKPHILNMCPDCQTRFKKNILRVYDCKLQSCKTIITTLPGVSELLEDEDLKHFQEVKNGLEVLGIKYEIDHRLVRGLDYYTRTIFEAYSDKIGACDALAGGGRYDSLFRELGASIDVPAVGFAVGLERVFNVLKTINKQPSPVNPQLFVVSNSMSSSISNLQLVKELRNAGFSVEFDLIAKSIKAQFKLAAKCNSLFAIIRGDDEVSRQVVKLKNLATREEKEISEKDLQKQLEKELF